MSKFKKRIRTMQNKTTNMLCLNQSCNQREIFGHKFILKKGNHKKYWFLKMKKKPKNTLKTFFGVVESFCSEVWS